MANQWKMESTSLAANEAYYGTILPPIVPYDLEINIWMSEHEEAGSILDKIRKHELYDLVINCHGDAGYISFGEYMSWKNVHLFERLKGRVERVFFTSCSVARVKTAKEKKQQENKFNGDGMYFCRNVAYWSKANVYASDSLIKQVDTKKGHVKRLPMTFYEFLPDWNFEPKKLNGWWDP